MGELIGFFVARLTPNVIPDKLRLQSKQSAIRDPVEESVGNFLRQKSLGPGSIFFRPAFARRASACPKRKFSGMTLIAVMAHFH